MSDQNDKSENNADKPEPEVLQPERNKPSPERLRKEPPVIDAAAEKVSDKSDNKGGADKPEAAAAPAASSEAPSGGSGRLYGAAAVAGLVGALIVGGGFYGAGLLSFGTDDSVAFQSLDARLVTVENNDGARADALKSVEEKLAVATSSADNAAAIASRLDGLENATGELKKALADADAAAKAGAARIDALQKQMPPADIAQQIDRLSAMVKALNTAVDSLAPKINDMDGRVARLEAKKDDPDAAARAALGLALSNLSRAATTSNSFARELDVVAAFLPNEPELAQLKTVAIVGVPTKTDIEARFPGLVQKVLDAERAAKNESLWQRFLSNARKLVTVRRTGEISGDDTDAVLARMEERMKRGDLSDAVVEAQGLKGAAAEAAAPWIKDATDRVKTSDLLSALTDNVTKRLAVGGKG
ncbi:MAG: mitofilin family membrane protein [Parvibaculum sp.]